MDTIFALASAVGRAGVAVVRISGPEAEVPLFVPTVKPRGRGLRMIRGNDGSVIDEALVLHFPEGESFTGEKIVELHLHGSSAVVSRVFQELRSLGLRLADPGEFTRRAFENGRLDLSQVESLADLIDAETEVQREQALRGLEGRLGKKAEEWGYGLLRAGSLLMASIDFADEDVPEDVSDQAKNVLENLESSISMEISGYSAARTIRQGFEVAIVGKPNSGKSTLLNAIARRDVAITSEIAGTTRDVIEVKVDIAGLPVVLLDTAGLRESADTVEKIGIERARKRAGKADLRIHLCEIDRETLVDVQEDDLVLVGKADQTGGDVSGVTGQGVEELLIYVGQVLSERVSAAGLVSHERQQRCLELAQTDIEQALSLIESGEFDIASDLIQRASTSLEVLVGRIGVEDMLGEVFSSFCIGK